MCLGLSPQGRSNANSSLCSEWTPARPPCPTVTRQTGRGQQHVPWAQCGDGCWLLIVHETNREKRTRRQVEDTGPAAGEAGMGAGNVGRSKAGEEVTRERRGPEGEGARCRQSVPEASWPRLLRRIPWQPSPRALRGVWMRELFLQHTRSIRYFWRPGPPSQKMGCQ